MSAQFKDMVVVASRASEEPRNCFCPYSLVVNQLNQQNMRRFIPYIICAVIEIPQSTCLISATLWIHLWLWVNLSRNPVTWMSWSSASTTQLTKMPTHSELKRHIHSRMSSFWTAAAILDCRRCSSSVAGTLWNIHHKVYSVSHVFFFFCRKTQLSWDPSQPFLAALCFADGGEKVALSCSECCHFSPTHLFYCFFLLFFVPGPHCFCVGCNNKYMH